MHIHIQYTCNTIERESISLENRSSLCDKGFCACEVSVQPESLMRWRKAMFRRGKEHGSMDCQWIVSG